MVTYSLRIRGFTPETLPLGRLGEYVSALAELLGDDVAATFHAVTKGSARLNVRIVDDDVPLVIARVRQAPNADEGSAARRGYDRIQSLLRNDKTSAEFRPQKGAVILKFPGAPVAQVRLPIVKEYGEINGQIIKVGGRDETIPVSIRTPDGEIVNCTATVEMARSLKPYLLEPIDVILCGMGRWKKMESGTWEAIEFKITDFSMMDSGDFATSLANVRAAGSGWDGVNDVAAELDRIRYGV